MKNLKRFEEFTDKTIDINNSTYNKYLNSGKKRSNKVAWGDDKSRLKNYNLVSDFIKNGDSLLDYGCGIGDFTRHLKNKKIEISDYLGVDINENYIDLAKKTYKNKKFQIIKDVDQIQGKWDVVCAIGVFTWYITKEEFIKTINKLYELSNKYVLITTLKQYLESDSKNLWEKTYRYYSEEIFTDLFPNMNIEFKTISNSGEPTLLIKINK